MNTRSNTCLCCDTTLLRHIRQGGIYWFCTSCYQEVPSRLSLKVAVGMSSRDTLGQMSRPLSAVNS